MVQQAISATKVEMERFYAERLREAEERGVRRPLHPLAILFRERGRRVGDAELETVLERVAARGAVDWIALRTSLLDLGVLWEAAPGIWEMGIPSFGDHVIRRETG